MTATTIYQLSIPAICSILLAVNIILAPRNPYTQKNNPFECGFLSFLWQNRVQFSISFFLFALLFLLFDLEVLLVYPYFLSSYTNDVYGLIIMVMFLILLIIGFGFELSKKALKIDSRQTRLVFIDIDEFYKDSYVNLLHSSSGYNLRKIYNYLRYGVFLLYINLRYILFIYIRYTLYDKLCYYALMYGPRSMLASVICGSNAWRFSEHVINEYTDYENWLKSISTALVFLVILTIASLLYNNWEGIFLSSINCCNNIAETLIKIKHMLKKIMLKIPSCIMLFIKAVLILTYYLTIIIFIHITLSTCPMLVCSLADLLNLHNISIILTDITKPQILYCEGGSPGKEGGSSSSSSCSTSGQSLAQAQSNAAASSSESVEESNSTEGRVKKRKATETIQNINKTPRTREDTPMPQTEPINSPARATRGAHLAPGWEQGCYSPELDTRDPADAHADYWTKYDFVDEWQSIAATRDCDHSEIWEHIVHRRQREFGTFHFSKLKHEWQKKDDLEFRASVLKHAERYRSCWEAKAKQNYKTGVDFRLTNNINRNPNWKNVK